MDWPWQHGFADGERLLAAGYPLIVYNRDRAKTRALASVVGATSGGLLPFSKNPSIPSAMDAVPTRTRHPRQPEPDGGLQQYGPGSGFPKNG
jgi:hypothetical protein